MITQKWKAQYAIGLCVTVVIAVSMIVFASAAEPVLAEQGLCPHHTEHTSECGYAAAVEEGEGVPCGYVCTICQVQEQIDALPSLDEVLLMDSEAQLEVYAQMQEVVNVWNGLKEAEQLQIDASRLTGLEGYFDSLYMQEGTDEALDDTFQSGNTVAIDTPQELTGMEEGQMKVACYDDSDLASVALEDIPALEEVNGWIESDNGDMYYYIDGVIQVGWNKIDDLWYFFDPIDGAMQTGWLQLGTYRYYLDSDGKMLTGWQEIGGSRYYLETGGGVMLTGWIWVDGYWYYLDSSGVMQTGWLQRGQSGQYRYYLNADGKMLTGWQKMDGSWYYFEPAGGVMQTGWLQLGTYRYYLDSDGKMLTGWQEIGGSWYYLETGGGVMLTGLWAIDGYNYIFNENGVMLVDCAYTIDNGTTYEIDVYGHATAYSAAMQYAKNKLDEVGWSLQAAFKWSSTCIAYSNRSLRAPAGSVHSEFYATYGFKNNTGNCYVMASTFCMMARVLGYDAYLVEGKVPRIGGGVTDHGWCEIVVDGTTYVCDPDFTYSTGRNGYLITYGTSGTWRYSSYSRVD